MYKCTISYYYESSSEVIVIFYGHSLRGLKRKASLWSKKNLDSSKRYLIHIDRLDDDFSDGCIGICFRLVFYGDYDPWMFYCDSRRS